MVLSHGQMAGSMKETMSMIRKRVKVLSIGPMEENTRVVGKMANNMAMDTTHLQVARSSKEDGMKERDCTGSMMLKIPMQAKQPCEQRITHNYQHKI